MATVKIDKFGGIVPRVHPSLLPDGMATEAHNCRLKSGKLVPLREPAAVDASEHTVYHEAGLDRIADAHSVYCWKHTVLANSLPEVRTDFLAFPGRVYFAHGNIADDKHDRIFVSGDTGVGAVSSGGQVRENCPAAYLFDRESGLIDRHCICKEPMSAPRCSVGSAPADVPEDSDAYFFVSWFDRYGYESPASAPSLNMNTGTNAYTDKPLRYAQGATITFQPIHVPPAAVGVRVYKTNSGDETASIQFLREYSAAELDNLKSEFSIVVEDTRVGETMPEIETPPYDLVDMSFVPGNYYAGRLRSMPHTVLFSDVDNPTNWPTAYRYDVRDNLVKLAVTSNSVVALTAGTPYVLSGTAPESMTVSSLATPAACVSEKSVVVYHNAVYFASNYGLFVIYGSSDEGTVCKCLTEQYMTKEQWQALNPASCVIGAFDGALHMFFTITDPRTGNVVARKAFIFDLTESANALTTHDEVATCLCTDDRSDDMYFVREV